MPLLNKRSDTPGARANLIPGEIGHNRADDKLLVRSDGRKIEVDLDKLRRLAPPASGMVGAPLSPSLTSVVWSEELMPAGVANGQAQVDAPPEGWGVPGLQPYDVRSAAHVADDVRIEPFWIASDAVRLNRIAFKVVADFAGAVRIGIFGADDAVWFDQFIANTTDGLNEITVDIPLARGLYKAVMWTDDVIEVATIAGYRMNQSFAVDLAAYPIFTRYIAATADMVNGLYVAGLPQTPQVDHEAGEDHAIMLRWTLP